MFIFAWNVYALVIISSFAGNLEAYLMIADNEKPVDSTKDIVEQVLTIHSIPNWPLKYFK